MKFSANGCSGASLIEIDYLRCTTLVTYREAVLRTRTSRRPEKLEFSAADNGGSFHRKFVLRRKISSKRSTTNIDEQLRRYGVLVPSELIAKYMEWY